MKVRALASVGTAILAGVLSLCLAVPANAADPFVPDPSKVSAPNPLAKYGFEYYRPVTGGVPAGPSSPWPRQTLNVNINPFTPGSPQITGSIPSNGSPTITLNPANQPLTGKIIEPGKTIVQAPSAYKPVAPFAGNLGLSRLLGTAGVGIGGVGTPPANANAIALSKGVPQTCIDTPSTCTQAQKVTLMEVNSCNMLTGTKSCSSINAQQSDGSPFGDWVKDTVIPMALDFWAWITGQGQPKADANGHVAVNYTKGCVTTYGFKLGTGSNGTVGRTTTRVVAPKPSQTTPGQLWDAACGGNALSQMNNASSTYGNLKTECVDPTTGKITNSGGVTQGVFGSISTMVNADGTNKNPLCSNSAHKLYSIKFYNTLPQSTYDGSTVYAGIDYSEWVNPDPTIMDIDDTRITTTWQCDGGNGAIVSYSKTVRATPAFVEPVCPPGSTLLNHKIEASNGTDTAQINQRTLDQGAQASGAPSAYPGCMPPNSGCAMSVQVDGQTCTASRTECQTWPSLLATTPSRVTCKWGTYTVAVGDCQAMLPNAYKSEAGTIWDPNSQTWTAIDTYGNPIASNPQPWNPTNPTPIPGSAVGTPPAPTTGTGTGTFPTTGTNPSDTCVSGGWSWNPVDWVKNPVICALKEAFVPKTDIGARIGGIVTTVQGKPPLSWFVPVWVPPSSASCPNWNVNIPGFLTKNVVCDSSFTAAIVGARSGMFGLVATAMVWPLIRGLWYAAIPILRVQAGSSK